MNAIRNPCQPKAPDYPLVVLTLLIPLILELQVQLAGVVDSYVPLMHLFSLFLKWSIAVNYAPNEPELVPIIWRIYIVQCMNRENAVHTLLQWSITKSLLPSNIFSVPSLPVSFWRTFNSWPNWKSLSLFYYLDNCVRETARVDRDNQTKAADENSDSSSFHLSLAVIHLYKCWSPTRWVEEAALLSCRHRHSSTLKNYLFWCHSLFPCNPSQINITILIKRELQPSAERYHCK